VTDFSEPRVPNTAYDRERLPDPEPDSDGDLDEEIANPEVFDGGYDRGSYFHQAQQHD
jgi:hypothetical protein